MAAAIANIMLRMGKSSFETLCLSNAFIDRMVADRSGGSLLSHLQELNRKIMLKSKKSNQKVPNFTVYALFLLVDQT